MSLFRFVPFFLVIVFAMTAAGVPPGRAAPEGTGLPLPRFVSLRANEVNMRTGPGVQYPVEWVYGRQSLPMEVIAEYRTWRKVRDWQGTQGWIHQSMLEGRRTVVITGNTRTLRLAADVNSAPVAQLESGVVVRLLECPSGNSWCKVETENHEGWLRRVEFWGVQRNEIIK